MPTGGTIRISVENSAVDLGTGLPLQDKRYVKVLIQDQGIGIEKEHLQTMFDPYFTTKEMGRGLGLSITYSIIKQHGGLITAESELGVGTTFTIYLPASEKEIEEQETVEDKSAPGEGKILLMDDEAVIRESVGELLTMKGYEVVYAEDGEGAIELYKKVMKTSKPLDAVILDLTIRGGMGGKATIKKLVEIDPDVKAIVSSGYANDPVMSNFQEYGFCDVYCKASDSPDDLSRILNKVIKE
jgi:CheY-like chemotaxis protein